MPGDVSRDFSEWELHQATKGGRASAAAVARYREYWVPLLLQPVRRIFGAAIFITSADRDYGGPAHQQGDASALDLGVAGNDPAELRRLHTIFATYFTPYFGRALLELGPPDPKTGKREYDHVHITRPGPEHWAGLGVVKEETPTGEWVHASLPLPPAPPGISRGVWSGILIALFAAVLAAALLA